MLHVIYIQLGYNLKARDKLASRSQPQMSIQENYEDLVIQ